MYKYLLINWKLPTINIVDKTDYIVTITKKIYFILFTNFENRHLFIDCRQNVVNKRNRNKKEKKRDWR